VDRGAGDGGRIGGIEDHEAVVPERRVQDFAPERRPAHAEEDDLAGVDGAGPRTQIGGFACHPPWNVEPAQSGGRDVAFGPEAGVARQQPVEELTQVAESSALFRSSALMSSSKDLENEATPSSSSTRPTSSMSTPIASSLSNTPSATWMPSSTVRAMVPWSSKAAMVCSGMVLTVSGPIRVST